MDSPHKLPPHKQVHALDSWRVLRILAEFVDGFETMVSLGPSVAFFGSASPNFKEKKYYEMATLLANMLAERGFGIITGGGPGIMEAANKGAKEAKGKSCGLCIHLPTEDKPNPHVDERFLLNHRYFFVRKVMFVRYAQAFIVFPGGFGTLDEFFESLTLIQTEKIHPFPVFMIGTDYWKGLIDWMKNTAGKLGALSESDFSLFTLTDDLEEVVNKIEEHYRTTLELENF